LVNETNRWAIICGHHINAYCIAHALREIGWQGRIVCLKPARYGPTPADLAGKNVETWEAPLCTPADIVPFLAERIPADDVKVIFFTSECFHEVFGVENGDLPLPATHCFTGATRHLATVLDRYEFYRFLEERGLAEVPRTLPAGDDPWRAFPNGFCFRPRRSWRGLRHTPRLRFVRSRSDWNEAVREARAAGLQADDWCCQEILSISPRHNLSICGWHADGDHTYLATRKVLQHPRGNGNGDVCEVCHPPASLLDVTARTLDALEYRGPFELEFVLDKKSGSYKLIELNPRFWMQHALIGAITGHELVRRYAGMPLLPARTRSAAKYWVNTVYAMFRMLRLDARVLRYVLSSSAVRAPTWMDSLRCLPPRAARLARKLPGLKSRVPGATPGDSLPMDW
jgi:hypothetical protein